VIAARFLPNQIGGRYSAGEDMGTYNAIIAASDTAAALKLTATAICDGTADEVEINAAIAAGVGVPYSILLLPGTYNIAAAVDFTALTAAGGVWMTFEASGSVIKAAANMATMIKLDPGAGGQIVTCADIRLGKLDGNASGGKAVTQVVNMARFNDNVLRIVDIFDGSGDAFRVNMTGVADFPNGNNLITIGIIHNFGGTGFYVTGASGTYNFQGNTVTVGEVIACNNGFVIGGAANDGANYNRFNLGVVEHNTHAGVYDYCGGNIWLIGNTNSNGDEGLGAPAGVTLRSTIITNTTDTIVAAVTGQYYVLNNGHVVGQT
jgi:hypothetical protein